jgi:simple sugar transport system ATP-binding protein
MAAEYAIEMWGITKTFGSVVANKDVDLTLRKGEILALLGENGSGKTTLMNMLSGIYQPDSGEILVDGAPVSIRSPQEAKALGIGMVHQHFKLVDVFTAADNIWMGREKPGFALKRGRYDEIREMAQRFGFDIDPRKKVANMAVSEKQTLGIIKVLYYGAKVIILDEPTAGLDPVGVESILGNIRDYHQAHNATIILVSHSMEEVARTVDRLVVVNDGRIPFHGAPSEVFQHGPELEAMGLGVPQMTRVFNRLRAMGVDIGPSVYTIEQAKAAVLAKLKGVG